MYEDILELGFTGTRIGMSENQKSQLIVILKTIMSMDFLSVHFHHGACIGADIEADQIARNLGCKIHIHPSTDSNTRVFCEELGDITYEPKPPLVRDKDIALCDILIAAPKSDNRIIRSGTWATVRYYEKLHGKEAIILKRG
jgi:hypothetical protein